MLVFVHHITRHDIKHREQAASHLANLVVGVGRIMSLLAVVVLFGSLLCVVRCPWAGHDCPGAGEIMVICNMLNSDWYVLGGRFVP